MKRDNNLYEAKRWFKQAESDLVAAEWSAHGKFYENSCFLCQQSVEKALKAFLFRQGLRGITGHSTSSLLDKCVRYDKRLEKFKRKCNLLDRHYIPTRYPNGLPDGTPHENYNEEDANEAIAICREILRSLRF
jgi:HEPN domain-containing protein